MVRTARVRGIGDVSSGDRSRPDTAVRQPRAQRDPRRRRRRRSIHPSGPRRRQTRPSAPQILRLLDDVIFNALIGNHDAHAKNFSLLHVREKPGEALVLAPLYDTLSTAVYANLT